MLEADSPTAVYTLQSDEMSNGEIAEPLEVYIDSKTTKTTMSKVPLKPLDTAGKTIDSLKAEAELTSKGEMSQNIAIKPVSMTFSTNSADVTTVPVQATKSRSPEKGLQ